MDTGAKTLAQLSEENKTEKKYVTLEVGSKISGYTKDYLERLCRLNKVEYRIWSNGSFVIELESLLRETQALLLSYEGINFVDKKELTDPTPQVVGSILSSALKEIKTTVAPIRKDVPTALPTFSETVNTPTAQVSFVGRAVVSDALHPEEKNNAKGEVKKSEVTETIIPPLAQVPKKEEGTTHIPITKFNMDSVRGKTSPVAVTESKPTPEHVPIVAVNSSHDDWDRELLGAHAPETSRHIPITKEVTSEVKSETLPSAITTPQDNIETIQTDFTPPSGQKVIVFSNNEEKEVLGSPSLPIAPAVVPATPLTETSVATRPPLLPIAPLSSLPVLTHTPELNTPLSKDQPIEKSTPLLPMKSEEHHLTPYEMHPLMKSTGFNLVFATMLIASSFTMIGGKIFENIGGKLNTASYVAGVGAVGGNLPITLTPTTTNPEKETVQATLPFSNDIVATSGKKENSIIVRPIFENGEEGKSYEYIITPKDSASSTSGR